MGLAVGSLLAGSGHDGVELLVIGRGATPPDHALFDLSGVAYAAGVKEPPRSETILLLAVPDTSIPELVDTIVRLGSPGRGCVALHFSGAADSAVLTPLRKLGYAIGSLHPLQTVADPRQGAEQLEHCFFTFEGEDRARSSAVAIVKAAKGTLMDLETSDKAGYHAACVFASNYVVACTAVAIRLLMKAVRIDESRARQALAPLWRGALENVGRLGPRDALTGPVSRGDAETVRLHLETLDAETRNLYCLLGREALGLARERGLEARSAEELGELFGRPAFEAPEEA